MRMPQIALLLLCINLGMYLVSSLGFFGSAGYSNTIINTAQSFSNLQAHTNSNIEMVQTAFSVYKLTKSIITYDWLTNLFMPWYATDTGVKFMVDTIRFILVAISIYIYAWSFVELVVGKVMTWL